VGETATAPLAATPATVPGAPTGLRATAGAASASLHWSAPTSNGGAPVTGYTILRASGSLSFAPVGSVTATSFTDRGLSNGTSYIFEVEARNSVGSSVVSNPAAVTPRTVPSAPRSVKAKPAARSINVTWTRPASSGGSTITGYVVEYATCKVGAAGCKAHKALAAASAKKLVVKRLSPAHRYYLDVLAKNAVGSGRLSARVSAKPKA
jgi:hypothetical protein